MFTLSEESLLSFNVYITNNACRVSSKACWDKDIFVLYSLWLFAGITCHQIDVCGVTLNKMISGILTLKLVEINLRQIFDINLCLGKELRCTFVRVFVSTYIVAGW